MADKSSEAFDVFSCSFKEKEMATKIFYSIIFLTLVSSCSSWQGSSEKTEPAKFMSYNSSKEMNYEREAIRVPASISEKSKIKCDNAKESRFLSYNKNKDYVISKENEVNLLCQ